MILLSKTKSSKKKRKTDVESDVSSPKKKSKYNKTSDISIDPTRSVPPEEEMIKNNDNEVIKATSEVWLNGQKESPAAIEAITNQNPIGKTNI